MNEREYIFEQKLKPMKKFLKILKITFITIFSILVLLALYFFISNKVFIGGTNDENMNYLNRNKVVVKDELDGKLFDDNFYQSQVFLLGEIHGFAANQTLDKQLLLFLNKKLGIKYYIAEMDSITAKKLNLYLSDTIKDNQKLKEVVKSIKQRIPQQSSQELFDKWSAVYDYNLKLNDSSKINIIGIDKNFDDESTAVSRDKSMLINFKNTVQKRHLEKEKFYGLFGFYHTLQDSLTSGRGTFAYGLKKEGIKTTSLVSYPIDSEMYLPKNPQIPTPEGEKTDLANADGPLMLVKGINDMKEITTPNTTTLFKINAADSPYLKSQNLISVKARVFGENIFPVENGNAAVYFQYVFLTRNSKALSKLK